MFFLPKRTEEKNADQARRRVSRKKRTRNSFQERDKTSASIFPLLVNSTEIVISFKRKRAQLSTLFHVYWKIFQPCSWTVPRNSSPRQVPFGSHLALLFSHAFYRLFPFSATRKTCTYFLIKSRRVQFVAVVRLCVHAAHWIKKWKGGEWRMLNEKGGGNESEWRVTQKKKSDDGKLFRQKKNRDASVLRAGCGLFCFCGFAWCRPGKGGERKRKKRMSASPFLSHKSGEGKAHTPHFYCGLGMECGKSRPVRNFF